MSAPGIHPPSNRGRSLTQIFAPCLNSVSDAGGQVKVEEVGSGPLTQDLLNHSVSKIFNKH